MLRTIFKAGDSCSGRGAKIFAAIMAANDLVNDNKLYKVIADKEDGHFYMANCSSILVAEALAQSTDVMTVEVYFPVNRFSKAIGYFDHRFPNKIFLNGYKLGRTVGSIAATLIHEWVHAVDADHPNYTFGHGDNKWSLAKEDTAPYWVDNQAEAMVDKKPIMEVPKGTNNKIKVRYISWWNPITWVLPYRYRK